MSDNDNNATVLGNGAIAVDRQSQLIIWVIGLTIFQLHFIGCVFVQIRTFIRWRAAGTLSLALRVPLYLSICDTALYVLYMCNGITVITTGATLYGTQCRVVGGLIFFTVSASMTLVWLTAVFTYIRVCKSYYISFGRYDWKLIGLTLMIPLAITMICLPSFGPDYYWCYANSSTKYVGIFNCVLYFGILVSSAFCYGSVSLVISKARSNFSKNSQGVGAVHGEDFETKVVRKIISYVLMFMVTWGPAMPYVIGQLVDYKDFWVYITTLIGLALGGVLNATQYIVNEGLWFNPASSSLEQSLEAGSTLNHSRRVGSTMTGKEIMAYKAAGI